MLKIEAFDEEVLSAFTLKETNYWKFIFKELNSRYLLSWKLKDI